MTKFEYTLDSEYILIDDQVTEDDFVLIHVYDKDAGRVLHTAGYDMVELPKILKVNVKDPSHIELEGDEYKGMQMCITNILSPDLDKTVKEICNGDRAELVMLTTAINIEIQEKLKQTGYKK